jgi:hypothetical protein
VAGKVPKKVYRVARVVFPDIISYQDKKPTNLGFTDYIIKATYVRKGSELKSLKRHYKTLITKARNQGFTLGYIGILGEVIREIERRLASDK